MEYNSESHIKTLSDVKAFFCYLLDEESVSFHPDDDFADYIDTKTKESAFSSDKVVTYNRLMQEAFDVCESERVDIYLIGFEETMKRFNKSA